MCHLELDLDILTVTAQVAHSPARESLIRSKCASSFASCNVRYGVNHNNDATVGFNGDGAEPYEGRTAGAQGVPDEPVAVVGGGDWIKRDVSSMGE